MRTTRSSRRIRVVLAAAAARPPALGVSATPAAAASTSAVVTGVVTGADGFPLQHVTVQAQFQFSAFPPITIATTVSKADGSYRLVVPLDDSDTFYVDTVADQATGGTSATGYADACSHKRTTTACTNLHPKAGSTTSGIGLVLPRAAEIVGRLTDAQGRGVGKVAVYPWPVAGCPFLDVGPTLPGTTSDVNGNYRITRLPAGETNVCIGSPYAADAGVPAVDGYDPAAFTVTVGAGTVTTHNSTLVAGGGVSGTVVDQFGTAVKGATATVTGDFVDATATTAAAGTFRVGRLTTGRHAWCITAPRYADACGNVFVTSEKTAKLGTVVLKRVS